MLSKVKTMMRRPFLAVLLAVSIFGVGAFYVRSNRTSAAPPPRRTLIIAYYSDESLSSQVGFRYAFCNGEVVTSGQVTSFTTVDEEPCCVSGGRAYLC